MEDTIGPLDLEGFHALRDRLTKPFGSIETPRDDAKSFRKRDKLASPYKCIVEMYELLWRWGNRKGKQSKNFLRAFQFSVPQTVVWAGGKPYAWYFISKKTGGLLRKKPEQLTKTTIEREFCRTNQEIVAQWIPMASQFHDPVSEGTPYVEFMNSIQTANFINRMGSANHASGILQAFVYPHGITNNLIRTVEFKDKISIGVRYNRLLLNSNSSLFKKCATYEGWPGLSSVAYRFNPKVSVRDLVNKIHSNSIEDKVREITITLGTRVAQERVRQMHFLQPTQYIAFHFKLDTNFVLNFIFASIISEEEVFVQTQNQLVLDDPIMIDPIGQATEESWNELIEKHRSMEDTILKGSVTSILDREKKKEKEEPNGPHKPYIVVPMPENFQLPYANKSPKKKTKLPPIVPTASFIPKIGEIPPNFPLPPYQANQVPYAMAEAGRFEYPPPFIDGGIVKQPLVRWDNGKPAVLENGIPPEYLKPGGDRNPIHRYVERTTATTRSASEPGRKVIEAPSLTDLQSPREPPSVNDLSVTADASFYNLSIEQKTISSYSSVQDKSPVPEISPPSVQEKPPPPVPEKPPRQVSRPKGPPPKRRPGRAKTLPKSAPIKREPLTDLEMNAVAAILAQGDLGKPDYDTPGRKLWVRYVATPEAEELLAQNDVTVPD